MNMTVPKEEKSIYQRSRSPNPSDRKRSHKHVEVCVIGAIEVIGDLEMTFNLNSYAQTTQCTETAEVFVLDQKNYERLIEKRNPQCLDAMREALHEKLKLRMSWAQEEDLPLFRYFLYKLDERERHEENKIKEQNRKRDLRETIDYWKSGKLFNGPLIDQYGPGSVFYTIRMRAKSRKTHLKVKAGAAAFGITRSLALMNKNQSGAYFSRKIGGNNGLNETPRYKVRSGSESDENEMNNNSNENDMDTADGQTRARNSKIFCENTRNSNNTSKNSNERSSRTNNTRSSCSVYDFMNQELNELSLTRLETRIEEWHHRVNKLEEPDETLASKLDKKQHLVKLHRYNAEESRKPLPGKKIILKPRNKPRPTVLSLHLEALDTTNRNATPPPDNPSPVVPRDVESRDPRDTWNDETDGLYRRSVIRRPLSSKPTLCSPPVQLRRRPKSARNYTAEDYFNLKEELRRKQIAYKSFFIRTGTFG